MYTGEEIIHSIASKNVTFATGWLLLSIALGSVLTFTFFAAISTSFYCCHKPSKKNDEDTQVLIHSGHSGQKLLFSNVPSTVYPTIQSIFQQEDNEVIDSLSPAYRELPSTHYASSFNASITSCCDNNATTVMPNSTEISVQPHSSLSSEQLNIQRISNDSVQQGIENTISNSSISVNMASTAKDTTILKQSPLPSNSGRINDSSQSIHITRALEDTSQFPMSTTSGIILEQDVQTIQREIAEETIQVTQPTIHDGQSRGPAMNDQRSEEPVITKGPIKEPLTVNQRINEPALNDQQFEDIYRASKNVSSTASRNTKHSENTADSLRGASSFGVVELSPKARAFSPDYYALTFRREGSDVSCSSLRGASAFDGSSQRSPQETSCVHERGASVFGKIAEPLHPADSFIMNGTRKQPHTQDLELTHESLSSHKQSDVEGSCTETRDEPLSCTQAISPAPNHSATEISVNSVQCAEANSSKVQCGNQKMRSIVKFPTYEDISAISTINQRPNSYPITKPYDELSKRTSGIKSSLLNNHRNDYNERSPRSEAHNWPGVKSKNSPFTNSLTTEQQHGTSHKPITSTARENIAPITIPAYTSRDTNVLRKLLQEKINLKKPKTTYQSPRGASQLGRLGDDGDDEDSDHDAFWDSVSLSFAYESPSEEDVELGFKRN